MPYLTLSSEWTDLVKKANMMALSPHQCGIQLSTEAISIDCTAQLVNEHIVDNLLLLAHKCSLQKKIDALFQGQYVNVSERRPALHTALRAQKNEAIYVNNKNVVDGVLEIRERIKQISEQIRSKQWFGHTGKPIKNIVNIGIGGSDFGPKFCVHALKSHTDCTLSYNFISEADPCAFTDAVETLSPENTLFIISSKSFTTQETLLNAKKAMEWLGMPIENHVIAVTAHPSRATALGIKHVLPIEDWVGGRFSSCSAINLITAIAIGPQSFDEFLQGAYLMDKHFQNTEFKLNLPVMLGLIGVWNNNFLNINNLLVLTYSKKLEYLVPLIQQLEMESNGKSVDIYEDIVRHATSPIVWGGSGNQAQHSYYQLLCQGTHKIAVDFVTLASNKGALIDEMFAAKKYVLTYGSEVDEKPSQFIKGNVPSNHICLKDSSPKTIGSLIALYEHKVYVQGVIWGINSFDQPGVEVAKKQSLCVQ